MQANTAEESAALAEELEAVRQRCTEGPSVSLLPSYLGCIRHGVKSRITVFHSFLNLIQV